MAVPLSPSRCFRARFAGMTKPSTCVMVNLLMLNEPASPAWTPLPPLRRP
jgi:hypothetical protein